MTIFMGSIKDEVIKRMSLRIWFGHKAADMFSQNINDPLF